jgi:hypothetical protein
MEERRLESPNSLRKKRYNQDLKIENKIKVKVGRD